MSSAHNGRDPMSKATLGSNAWAATNEPACLPTLQPTNKQALEEPQSLTAHTHKTANSFFFGPSVLPAQLCHLWLVAKTPQIYFSTRLTTAIDEGRLLWFLRWVADLLLSHGCRICLFPPPDYTSSNDMLKPLVCFSAFIFNLTKASCDNIRTHSGLWYIQYNPRPQNAVKFIYIQ